MDGELNPALAPIAPPRHDEFRETIGPVYRPPTRTRKIVWLMIVGLLLVLLLGGLYGYNSFRSQAISAVFANMKPPPAQIVAVTATRETVPNFATGIGSLAAV